MLFCLTIQDYLGLCIIKGDAIFNSGGRFFGIICWIRALSLPVEEFLIMPVPNWPRQDLGEQEAYNASECTFTAPTKLKLAKTRKDIGELHFRKNNSTVFCTELRNIDSLNCFTSLNS